ncbi:hypothetical protein PITC_088740 [Penicillium italicum]|uniref:Uncharacterized protein n=1 Tax=Penicillium italicum TaxID=40296 RepID=A0A0A2LIV8_PENIT|nr:hypothetical protein PITC_088740 [Penicillium italicum]
MRFCPFQRRASEPPTQSFDLDYPLIDLSSLEGAPMIDPKFIVPLGTTVPRIHTKSRASIQYLLSKPLPPRPASTEAISPTLHCNGLKDLPPSRPTINDNKRRASAHRRTSTPPDALSPNCDPNYEYEMPPRMQRISHPPVRPRVCVPLTWLEDEKKWIVGERYTPRTHDSRLQDDVKFSQSPVSPISPISPITPWDDKFQHRDEHIDYNNRLCRENLLSQPPPFGGRRVSPTHDTALVDDRVSNWVATARRMHEDRRNWA